MLCITLSEFVRDCSVPVSGGISDIVIFDPEDFNFTQPAPVNGKAQKYSVMALRAGAVGSGGTAATATFTLTAVGANGDVLEIRSPYGELLGSFTKTATETTVTLLAAAIVGAINAGTHGYAASNVAGVVTVTAPLSLGDSINTLNLVVDDGGTIAATKTAFTGGVDSTGGKVYQIQFQRDEASWEWKQSRKGPSVKYEHTFTFQLPDNSQQLTTFLQGLDAAAACCGLGMIIRLTGGKIFVCGEKFVNNTAIPRFTLLNEGSNGTTGKLYDDANVGNIILVAPYNRSLYEFSGTWADIEALM